MVNSGVNVPDIIVGIANSCTLFMYMALNDNLFIAIPIPLYQLLCTL